MAVVADGAGGCKEGEVASGYAAEALTEWFYSEFLRAVKWRAGTRRLGRLLQRRLEKINEEIREYGQKQKIPVATTVGILLLFGSRYLVAHAGDTRIYRIKRKRCRRMTEDHVIGPGVLSRCLGMKGECSGEIQWGRISPKTGFLLCSDGYWRKQQEKVMGEVLHTLRIKREEEIQRRLLELGESAFRAGETDNMTAVYVIAR